MRTWSKCRRTTTVRSEPVQNAVSIARTGIWLSLSGPNFLYSSSSILTASLRDSSILCFIWGEIVPGS